MFADEARFGRMNRPRPCWAPTGVRPEVAAQLVREYVYLYGAVCPKDGRCVYLIMPASDTACFQIYLDVLSRKYRRQQILLVLDGAPNHQCGLLAVPDNISLLFLPPYSPQLNPKENLWDEIREKISLDKDCPDTRPVHRPAAGKIIAFPEVGGLHHRYERRAA